MEGEEGEEEEEERSILWPLKNIIIIDEIISLLEGKKCTILRVMGVLKTCLLKLQVNSFEGCN